MSEILSPCSVCGESLYQSICRCVRENASKVNHPKHYNMGSIEVIDAIETWGLGFNDGNAVKYIVRHQHKENPIQDIEKAIWYLQRHLNNLVKEKVNEID